MSCDPRLRDAARSPSPTPLKRRPASAMDMRRPTSSMSYSRSPPKRSLSSKRGGHEAPPSPNTKLQMFRRASLMPHTLAPKELGYIKTVAAQTIQKRFLMYVQNARLNDKVLGDLDDMCDNNVKACKQAAERTRGMLDDLAYMRAYVLGDEAPVGERRGSTAGEGVAGAGVQQERQEPKYDIFGVALADKAAAKMVGSLRERAAIERERQRVEDEERLRLAKEAASRDAAAKNAKEEADAERREQEAMSQYEQ